VPPVGGEHPGGQATAETGRQQVVGPGVQLGQGHGDLAGQHRRAVPVEAEGLDLGVGHRGLEVGAQRLRRAGGGQRGVPAGLGVAHGQPGGVEGQYPPQRLQRRRRPLGQIGTGRQSDLGQLLP
jgi:hypothetical protein